MTFQQFISDNGITMTATYADRNPNMDDSDNMDHWRLHSEMGAAFANDYLQHGHGP